MSSILPSSARRLAQRLAEQGVEMLDAPVSGGERGAIDGTLSIMVGGPEDAFRRALPIFGVLGEHVTHVGGAGAGQIAKACNQLIVGATIQAVGEALVLAAKAGVDPGGGARSAARRLRREQGPRGARPPDAGARLRSGVPLGAPSEGCPDRARDRGGARVPDVGLRGGLDHSALVTLLEDRAGVVIGTGSGE
jgi:2-hydroxy-3-oxopropionate reductase